MKNEIEFKWMINLLNSPYAKNRIIGKRESGCKIDFEKHAQAPSHNKEFRNFFNQLVKGGFIYFFEIKKTRGGSVETYVINYNKLKDKLKENILWKNTIKLVNVMDDLT